MLYMVVNTHSAESCALDDAVTPYTEAVLGTAALA